MTKICKTRIKAPHAKRRPRAKVRSAIRYFVIVLSAYLLPLTCADLFSGAARLAAQTHTGDTRESEVYTVTGDGSTLKEIDGEMVLEFPNGVRIEHEDVIATARRGLHYDGWMVTFLIGDVEIVQGTMTMWGDEGEYRRLEDLAIMRGNVRIVDEGWEVTCDEARYFRSTERGWLLGNIVAKDSVSTLYADSLFYDREAALTEVFGNLRITNPDEGFAAEGDHGYYFRETGEGVIDRRPHLIVDPESPEPVTIDSDTMRVYPDDSHAVAYYTVKILKGNTVTQCDSAVLYDNENRAELYGTPLAKQDRVSMKGEMMALYYDEEEVNQIDINGGAEIREEQTDSLVIGRDNWIVGDTMTLYLRENRVDSIRVLHNATSEYYPTTLGKTESNFVRGDSMFFRFDADSLSYVRIIGSADGIYKFVNLTDEQTTDSLRAVYDTNLTYVPFPEKAEKVVYSAKQIEYMAETRDLILRENATIKYQNRELSSDRITYLSSLQLMDARGEPKLVDGGQEFFGDKMDYDLDAEVGVVNRGATRFGEGFYIGKNVAKVGDDEMRVWNSRYTTCDFKVPHYHIKAKHMKVYLKDKAVSGSTVLYIGETPVFYLPFIANSIRRGRRSGFLRPDFEFGITKQTGRYIRNIGYFWATNDYTDFNFVFDFNEDRQIRSNVRNRYNVRYKFNGQVMLNYLRDLTQYTNRWEVSANHDHTLGEKFWLKSELRFVSDDEALKDIYRIDDVNRVIDREIRSNLALSKSWNTVGFSLSAKRTQKLNVQDPNVVRLDEVLPSVQLSIPQRDLFFGERHRESEQGFWEKLLTGIKYSPGLSGQRRTTEKEYESKEVITSRQSLGFQSPQRVSFITISPTFSTSNTYTHTVTEVTEHDETTTQPDTTITIPASRAVEDDNEFRWSMGANASTNFFGTFYPRVGRLRGIRHKLSPVVSYSFNPKIGDRPRSQSVSVRLTNSFDLKVLRKTEKDSDDESGGFVTRTTGSRGGGRAAELAAKDQARETPETAETDESEEEQLEKISGFLIWTLSSRYNPEAAKNEGWSNISSTVNLRAFGTSISINQTIEPYEMKLISTSVQSGFTIRGTHPFGRSEKVELEELNIIARSDTSGQRDNASPYGMMGEEGRPRDQGMPGELAVSEGRLPWSVRAGFDYNKTIDNIPRATMQLSADLNLTKNWRFTYWTSYDIEAREMRGQNIGVHRDLHCWEMSLSRQLLGDEWQFYFRISIKAHPEIYGETGQRGLGGFAGGITQGSFIR